MVRRRERWANLAWLQWMGDDTGEGMVTTPFAAPMAVGSALNALIRDYRRYVDMEQMGDGFLVRVMPQVPSEEIGPLNFGATYSGTNLRNILTTAVVECDMILAKLVPYRTGATEKWRWVR